MKAVADDNLAWTHLSDLKYWDSEIPLFTGFVVFRPMSCWILME